MKQQFPRINPMGERAILIEFEPEINEALLQKILFYKNKLQEFYDEQKLEVINTYNSLLIRYYLPIEDLYGEVSSLEKLINDANVNKNENKQLYTLPVCYSAKFGLDLELISEEKKISIEEIISLHSDTIYTVYFIGFLPGFLYLGGLDEKLHMPRKEEPRLKIEKGAVGIGGKQTGIYPQSSPGGWQLIGNCPVPIFDKNSMPPCAIAAGDRVKFQPVSEEEFENIKNQVTKGEYNLKAENYVG